MLRSFPAHARVQVRSGSSGSSFLVVLLLSAIVGFAQEPNTAQKLIKDVLLSGSGTPIIDAGSGCALVSGGSWTKVGGSYRDPLTIVNGSDHDLRMLVPDGMNNVEALQMYNQTRARVASRVRAQFGANGNKVLEAINIYPPEQLMAGVTTEAEAVERLSKLGIGTPNLGGTPVEGLWSSGRFSFARAYERSTGRIFYNSGGAMRSGFADIVSDVVAGADDAAVYTLRGASQNAAAFAEKVAHAVEAGKPEDTIKNLQRTRSMLGKSYGLAQAEGSAGYLDDVIAAAKADPFPLLNPTLRQKIVQATRRASLEARLLEQIQNASVADNELITRWLRELQSGGTTGQKIMQMFGKVPFDKIGLGLHTAFSFYQAYVIAGKVDSGDIEGALREAGAWVTFEAIGMGPGTMVMMANLLIDEAKSFGYDLVAQSQSCEDLLAGVFTVKGREVNVLDDKVRPLTVDDLVTMYQRPQDIETAIAYRANHAASRGLGKATGESDKAVEQRLNDRCNKETLVKWTQKRNALDGEIATLYRTLASSPVSIIVQPDPAVFPAAQASYRLRATLQLPLADLQQTVQKMEAVLARLAGKSQYAVMLRYEWQLDGTTLTDDGDRQIINFEVATPGPHVLYGEVKIGIASGTNYGRSFRDLRKYMTTTADVTVGAKKPGEKPPTAPKQPGDKPPAGKPPASPTATPPITNTPQDTSLNGKVTDIVVQFIQQFADGKTCFGDTVKLGNPARFRKELAPLTILIRPDENPRLVTYQQGALFGVLAIPENEMRIPFDPLSGKWSSDKRLKLYHEAIHQIEAMRGMVRDNSKPGAERNTEYATAVVGALNAWAGFETRLRNGDPLLGEKTPLEAYRELEQALRDAKATWQPDRELQVWAGFDVRFEQIQDLYLSGACDKNGALKALALQYAGLQKTAAPVPPTDPKKPADKPPAGTPPASPTAAPPTGAKPAADKPPAGATKPGDTPPAAGTNPPAAPPPATAPGAASPSSGSAAGGYWALTDVQDSRTACGESTYNTSSNCTVSVSGTTVTTSAVVANKPVAGISPPPPRSLASSGSWTEFPKTLAMEARVSTTLTADGGDKISKQFPTLGLVGAATSIEGECSSVEKTRSGLRVGSGETGTYQWYFQDQVVKVVSRTMTVRHLGPGGEVTRTYTYTWTPGAMPATPLADGTAPIAAALIVTVKSDTPAPKLRDTVTLSAQVTGGTAPYTYAWTGAASGTAAALPFVVSTPGRHEFIVTAIDAKGAKATAALSVEVKALTVTIALAGGSPRIPFGQTRSFQAKVSSPGGTAPPAGLVYRWQPNPEVTFTPFEGSKNATMGEFHKLGIVKVWVEVLQESQTVLSTVAESNQLEIEVVKPELNLVMTPAESYPGQEVRITASESPAVGDGFITYWWEYAGSVLNPGAEANPRVYSFRAKDMTPVTVTAHAKARDGGDDLGTKTIVITARPHTVQVTGPTARGPKPQIWNPKTGLVDVDQQIAVFQDVSLRADVTPTPINQPLHYQWTVSPDGCSISNALSQEPTFNCSQTGGYNASVTVRDHLGATVGTGTGSVSISISQATLQTSKAQADEAKLAADKKAAAEAAQQRELQANRDTADRLRKEGAALEQQGQRREAVSKYRESLKYVPDPALERYIAQVEAAALTQERAAQAASQREAAQAASQKEAAQQQTRIATGQRLRSEGIELQKAGRLQEAAAKYRESLTYRPDPELATIIPQLDAAVARVARGLRLRSEGIELQKKGKLREAAAKYRESLTFRPDPELETIIPKLEAEAATRDKQKKPGWEEALGAIAGEIDAQVQREREAEKKKAAEKPPAQAPPATVSRPPAQQPPAATKPAPPSPPAPAPTPAAKSAPAPAKTCSLTGEWAGDMANAQRATLQLRQDGDRYTATYKTQQYNESWSGDTKTHQLRGTVSGYKITIEGYQFTDGAIATLIGYVSPDCQSMSFGSMWLERK